MTKEVKDPRLGIIAPSKEVDMTNLERVQEMSERYFSDIPTRFIGVYHHGLLPITPRDHTPPQKGESRYTAETPFPDPILLLSILAQNTSECELFTSILVAPLIQTVQLAQQATMLSQISKGKFRLGVGVGWNRAEFEAAGQNFKRRGKKLNNQIPVLELLLAGKEINYQIGNEQFNSVAINPTPENPIPIWIGGSSTHALQRAALYGDGWLPLGDAEEIIKLIPELHKYLQENNREAEGFPIMGRIPLGTKSLKACVKDFLTLKNAGVSHIALTTTGKQMKEWEKHRMLILNFLIATEEYRWPYKKSGQELFSLD